MDAAVASLFGVGGLYEPIDTDFIDPEVFEDETPEKTVDKKKEKKKSKPQQTRVSRPPIIPLKIRKSIEGVKDKVEKIVKEKPDGSLHEILGELNRLTSSISSLPFTVEVERIDRDIKKLLKKDGACSEKTESMLAGIEKAKEALLSQMCSTKIHLQFGV